MNFDQQTYWAIYKYFWPVPLVWNSWMTIENAFRDVFGLFWHPQATKLLEIPWILEPGPQGSPGGVAARWVDLIMNKTFQHLITCYNHSTETQPPPDSKLLSVVIKPIGSNKAQRPTPTRPPRKPRPSTPSEQQAIDFASSEAFLDFPVWSSILDVTLHL